MTNLTTAQRAVVESTAPRILVVAGPGSGKTHTMVERVRAIIARGTPAEKIVVITFTNAGALELNRRLTQDAKPHDIVPRFGYLGTLHGFALRELQRWGQSLGYGPRITVLDEKQSIELLMEVAQRTGYKGTQKALLTTLEARGTTIRTAAEITVAQYRKELRAASAVDFDTILWDFLQLQDNEAQLASVGHRELRWRWDHLIVDEYQDSGTLDALIYAALPVGNRCFVGDPDQAIYGFRGATVSNILELAGEPGTTVFTLSENFRCAGHICSAANRLIGHNRDRLKKTTLSAREVTGEVLVRPENGIDEQERTAVLMNVEKLLSQGTPAMELAILCRYNATAAEFIAGAEAMRIPVRKKAATRLPRDWAATRAALELLNNPTSELCCRAWLRLKDGPQAAASVIHRAALAQRPLHTFLPVTLPPAGMGVWPGEAPTWLARLGISREAIELVDAKAAEIPEPTLPAISFAIARDQEHQAEMGEGVTITTIHGAKGREWAVVYLVACEQEIMPGMGSRRDLEEERRICFVGITRAKDRLLLSAATSRRQAWGDKRHAPSTPSQFLAEVAAQ